MYVELQLLVLTIGFTDFSQFHQGSKYALPIVTPLLRVATSTLPLSKKRVSSGDFIIFFCIFGVISNSTTVEYDRLLVFIDYASTGLLQ